MTNTKINNFLRSKTPQGQSVKKWKKPVKITLLILAGLVLIFAALILIYKEPATQIFQQAQFGKDNFLKAQDELLTQNFDGSKEYLDKAIINFQSAKTLFNKFKWLKIVPWVGSQISAIDNLLLAGISTGQSILKVNELAITIISPLKKNDDISLASLSEKETKQLLGDIAAAKPVLEDAKKSIDEATDYINKIPEHGLITKIKESAVPLKEKVPQLQNGLDVAISASQIIPSIAGYPEQKTYLFLLQNNTELRPTGGFIGTYGILKVQNGDIKSFNTDNVYNLDEPAAAWLNEQPPWPLTRYNKVNQWFLRDSNWSPDFPTSAQKALWFYQQERGQEKKIDGVIAITPVFIESLLKLTGEMKVNGLTFTSDNFVSTLQYQVDQGFLRQGLELTARKEIIGVLSKEILDSIMNLPQKKWPDLWQIFQKDISQKQILIFSYDNSVQNYIIKENWGGEILKTNGDYLEIIDANLASLKSDPGVHRTITYTVRRDGQNFVADVIINYNNTGSITWKTTRYRSYTRFYVPAGAKLLKTEGAMIDCKIDQAGSVETTEESGKTVFGTFICIEPNEEKQLHFKYILPGNINEDFSNNLYSLTFQKQPGTDDYNVVMQINLDKKIKKVESLDNYTVKDNNELSINAVLDSDKSLVIHY